MDYTLLIRDEEDGDAPGVRALHQAAFQSAMEADIVDRLRATCPERVSLVAVEGERVVGHILFTPAIIEPPSGGRIGGLGTQGVTHGMGLAPMAVLPDLQRGGIGSTLIRTGVARLRRSGCPFVIVVGHPEYYPRFGFVRGSQVGVACQWPDVSDEAFMILVLDSALTTRLAGRARYRPEFDESV